MGCLKWIRVKVVDELGRTVCAISKRSHFDKQMRLERTEAWCAQAKPTSEKWFAREDSLPSHQGRLSTSLPVQRVDGQKYLALQGLTLKWEKVEAALDKVAFVLGLVDASGTVLKDDLAAATITIDQLRKFA